MKTTCAYDFWGNHIEANPFDGLLAESDYIFKSTGSIYKVRAKDIELIPAKPGVYIIIGRNSVYCGMGKNLRQRVSQSISKQGFGEWVFFIHEDEVSIQDDEQYYQFFTILEALCIRALSTMRTYNNLPIKLTNQKHRKPLPPIAWKDPENSRYKLPITMAQTALSNFMPPNPPPHKISPFEYAYRLWPIKELTILDVLSRKRIIWAPRIVQTLAITYVEPPDELSEYRKYLLSSSDR
ncbi:hypothetical protein [Thioclava sp. F36-7]|uniref:hypothetical protein n=1 Tax=Thioclava sp. F36-7 TaxID=1915317 RepID=UPI00117D5227|nr:hypothetical protein [Thioclava sp. F36-7]